MTPKPLIALCLALLVPVAPLWAQSTEIALGGIRTDRNAPVEITADRLEADQAAGTAVFLGNVVVGQGPLRLAAPRVEVIYATGDTGRMERVLASGGVTMTSGSDAAEGQEAVYTLADSTIVMTGDVLLTQGPTTIAGQRFTANLADGTGRMEGRVAVVIPAAPAPADGTAGSD